MTLRGLARWGDSGSVRQLWGARYLFFAMRA
jgi:hypothetical protein